MSVEFESKPMRQGEIPLSMAVYFCLAICIASLFILLGLIGLRDYRMGNMDGVYFIAMIPVYFFLSYLIGRFCSVLKRPLEARKIFWCNQIDEMHNALPFILILAAGMATRGFGVWVWARDFGLLSIKMIAIVFVLSYLRLWGMQIWRARRKA
jgi:hypothetical protein